MEAPLPPPLLFLLQLPGQKSPPHFRRPLPAVGAWSHPAGFVSWLLGLLAQERFPKSDVPAPRKGQAQ